MMVFSAHQMGTARMGASPKTSAVDERGECWHVRNLYVADASLFPTSSGERTSFKRMPLLHHMHGVAFGRRCWIFQISARITLDDTGPLRRYSRCGISEGVELLGVAGIARSKQCWVRTTACEGVCFVMAQG